jgi:hypothetical protein
MQKLAWGLTWALDYASFGGYMAAGIHFLGDADLTNPKTALKLFGYFWLLSDLMNVRDWLYMKLLPSTVISHKKKVEWKAELFMNMVSTRLFAYGAGVAFAYVGLLHFPVKGYTIPQMILYTQLEPIVTGAVRDFFGMYLAHEWMHRKAYHLHKAHHRTTPDVNSITNPNP